MTYQIRKHLLSAEGKYYIDCDACIDHSCYEIAPANLKMDEEFYTTYVFNQPETLEEETQCKEAKAYCPVEAIHDDGE